MVKSTESILKYSTPVKEYELPRGIGKQYYIYDDPGSTKTGVLEYCFSQISKALLRRKSNNQPGHSCSIENSLEYPNMKISGTEPISTKCEELELNDDTYIGFMDKKMSSKDGQPTLQRRKLSLVPSLKIK